MIVTGFIYERGGHTWLACACGTLHFIIPCSSLSEDPLPWNLLSVIVIPYISYMLLKAIFTNLSEYAEIPTLTNSNCHLDSFQTVSGSTSDM